MFDIVKTLGRGYATPEEALAPLLEAKDSLPHIRGYPTLPESEITYSYGGGQGHVELPVRVSVGKEDTGYSITVEIDRVALSSRIAIGFVAVVAGLTSAFYYFKGGFTGPEAFLAFSVGSLLGCGLFLLSGFEAAHAASKDFAWAYRTKEADQAPGPVPRTREGRS